MALTDRKFSSDLRRLMTTTKVCALLHDKPLVILRQETTVELALQVQSCPLKRLNELFLMVSCSQ
jgi:hypothetical protein